MRAGRSVAPRSSKDKGLGGEQVEVSFEAIELAPAFEHVAADRLPIVSGDGSVPSVADLGDLDRVLRGSSSCSVATDLLAEPVAGESEG